MANTDPQQGAVPNVASAAATTAGMKAALEDRSKYIRTMAKDMAALVGTPAPTPVQAPTKAPEPSKTETVGGVTLEKEEHPFFERPQSRAEKEGEETVSLPTMTEAADIVTSEPTDEERAAQRATERAAVLERLRQNGAERPILQTPVPLKTEAPAMYVPKEESSAAAPSFLMPAEPVAAPTPAPEPVPAPAPAAAPAEKPKQPAFTEAVSAWSNIPSPAPSFAPLTEPVPPRMPPVTKESYREPIEAYVPPRPITPTAPGALHTYTSDFANRIDTKGSSAFSVLAAEQDANAKAPTALTAPRKSPVKALVTVGTGVLFLVLGGGAIFGIYQFVMTMNDTPIAALTVPSIVFADEYRELEGSGPALLSALASSANGALVSGNVLVTYILTSATDESGSILTTPAGGDAFIRALQLDAPDILLRNIAKESTVGVVNAGGQTRAFFALRVDSYERTYAGMLTWEPLMARDLGVIYPLYPAEEAVVEETVVATTTSASTTPATSTPAVFSEPIQAVALTRFEDDIIANHDVRILRDTAGKTLILYGYADKRTLIIARDEAAFEALLARLKAE